MPIVQVTMYPGRTLDQKRRLVRALTDVMVDVAGATRGNVNVVFYEVDSKNWSIAGDLGLDRAATAAGAGGRGGPGARSNARSSRTRRS
jgi:4-oxalocrotonate tautomerase